MIVKAAAKWLCSSGALSEYVIVRFDKTFIS